ncbi:hypothetical protein HJG60_008790 [Phyllostomus discolor]|uniref:Uncharacterized protein n=1 Tax=Phyllostomus discolor TaxID=89673 RepID=A0A834DI52_9CHIR|nr:hypothetical protein HJG60_008790 [Phyllostomus discolor]
MGLGRSKVTLLKPLGARQPPRPQGSPGAAVISSVTPRCWARGVTAMETGPWGSEAGRGLLPAPKCFAPKMPPQEQAQELPGRPPTSLVTPRLGNSVLRATLFAGGGLSCAWCCRVCLRRGRGGRATEEGEGMCAGRRERVRRCVDPGSWLREFMGHEGVWVRRPAVPGPRGGSLSGAVTSAGLARMQPTPGRTERPRTVWKGTLRFSQRRKT